jgi:uncharacterized protein YbaP (TraB family)
MRPKTCVESVLPLFGAALLLTTCGAQPGSERAAAEAASRRATAPVATPSDPARGMTFLWRLSQPDDPRKVVYLFGSIHVARPDFYPLDPAIEQAFAAADALVVEAAPGDLEPAKLQTETIRRALLPAGETLKDRISPETWAALDAALRQRNVPLATVTNFEPWFAALLIEQQFVKERGLDPALGVDRHFIERAGAQKPIEALETASGQIGILDGLGPRLQELVLADALAALGPEGQRELDRMLEAWRAGDGATMHSLFRESLAASPEAAPLYDALVTRRNAAMADAIDALIDDWNRLFVVIGAGHLAGDGGVVALLERRGWTAEQVPASGDSTVAPKPERP